MAVMDEILQAIGASTTLDGTAKGILTEFVQTAGPALANVAPAVIQEILAKILSGDAGSAATPVAGHLSEAQIVQLLGTEAQQMNAAADAHAAQVAATRAAMTALQNAALSIMAKLLVSVL